MGNKNSQPLSQKPSQASNVEIKISGTPEKKCAQNFSNDESSQHIMALIDPRSPTVEISRTPITVEEERARREKMMKMMLSVKNASGGDKTTPVSSGDLPLGFDPRSPSYDIQRTPIVIEDEDVENSSKTEDFSFTNVLSEKRAKRDLETTANGQLCRDLRKRLFISQRLNMSDTELLNASNNDDENKENN